MKIFGLEIKKATKKEIDAARKFSWSNPDVIQRVISVGGYPFYVWDFGKFDSKRADRIDVNFGRAVRIIGDAICGLPIKLKQDEDDIEEHDFLTLIRRPNDVLRFDELLRHAIQGLMIDGESHWRLGPDGIQPPWEPKEIWPVVPDVISIRYQKGIPIGYNYRSQHRTIPLKLEEIVHFKLYDMRTPFKGAGLVDAIRDEMGTSRKALRYHEKHFGGGLLQDLMFLDKTLDGLTEEQREVFLESVHAKSGGAEKAGEAPLIPGGIEIHERPSKLKDMAFGELVKFNREQIYAGCGIPPSVGGIYEYANYANALIQEKGFWQNTVRPFLSLIELTIKHQILDRFWMDERMEVEFDVSNVSALQEDALQQSQRLRQATGKPYITVNEAREEIGKEPIEGGDELPSMGIAYDPDEETNRQNQKQKLFYIDDVLYPRKPPDRAAEWFAFDRRAKAGEARYQKAIKKYFNGQRQRLIASLRRYTDQGQFMSRIYFANDDDGLFDLDNENQKLAQQIKPLLKAEMGRAGRAAIGQTGKNTAFDITNPRVIEKIQALMNRSKKINDATFADIKKLLEQAYSDQWEQSKLIKEIHSLYKEYGYTRAEMIARTEMAGVMNTGAEEGYRQAGVKKKEWMASLDGATRDDHAAADGQIVDIDQPFNIGGEMLMAPGDPNGSAANVINCRCTLLPVE